MLPEGEVVSVLALSDTLPSGAQHTQPILAQLLEVCVASGVPPPEAGGPSPVGVT